MALKTNYPPPADPPKEPQPKDQLPKEHDTTSGPSYGTTEGVKASDTSFEQVETPKPTEAEEDAHAKKDALASGTPAPPSKAKK